MTTKDISTIITSADSDHWTMEQASLADFIGMVVHKKNEPDILAPLGVRAAFLAACERTGLDPIARQIYLLLFDGKWTIMSSIDGLRLVAERSGKYRGQTPAQWSDGVYYDEPVIVEGKIVTMPDGTVFTRPTLRWTEAWSYKQAVTNKWDDTKSTPEIGKPPAFARVGVYKGKNPEPFWGVTSWDAYSKTFGQWVKNGPHMLAKCAEALALRKAFPQDLSGIIGEEELDREEGVVEGQRDWEAEAKATKTSDEITLLYAEMKDAKQWTRHLDAIFRDRKLDLLAEEAKRAEDPETVIVAEEVPA